MIRKNGKNIIVYVLVLLHINSVFSSVELGIYDRAGNPVSTLGLMQEYIIKCCVHDIALEQNFAIPTLDVQKISSKPIYYGLSQSVSLNNGHRQQSMIYSYLFRPDRLGTITIAPVTIVNDQKQSIRSNGLSLEVVAKVERNDKTTQSVFAQIVPVISEPFYVGQKIPMELQICFKQQESEILLHEWIISDAQIVTSGKVQHKDVLLQGAACRAKVIAFDLYPSKVGELMLPPIQVELLSNQQNFHFGLLGVQGSYTIESDVLLLAIQKLPVSDKYNDVTAIGSFNKLTFELEKTTIKTGQGIVARLTVFGDGNCKVMTAPNWQLSDGLYAYEGNSLVATDSKTFEWIVQADKPGTYTVQAPEFSFYDIKESCYKSLKAEAVTLEVTGFAIEKVDKEAIVDAQAVLQEKDEKIVSPQDTRVVEPSNMFDYRAYNWGLIAFVLAGLLGLLFGIYGVIRLLRWYRASFYSVKRLYRHEFAKADKIKSVTRLYQMFESLMSRYGLGLESQELGLIFNKLGYTPEVFENWLNFVGMMHEFNFSDQQSEHDIQLVFDLAKQWFPIILSCCKSLHNTRL